MNAFSQKKRNKNKQRKKQKRQHQRKGGRNFHEKNSFIIGTNSFGSVHAFRLHKR